MDWICGEATLNGIGTDAFCTWLVPPSELRENFTDPTLMATMVWVAAGSIATSESGLIGGFGIIVWNFVDDTIPSECPGPLTECEADWIYLDFFPMTPNVPVTIFYNGDSLDRRSQAKRRLGNDKGILLVAQAIGGTFNFHAHVRCLIKE